MLGSVDQSNESKKFPGSTAHGNEVRGAHSTIPADRLLKLKQLFAEDGISLTDAQALEIGLWLLARVKPVLRPVPLDKMELFATIRNEAAAIRRATPFVNLYELRRPNLSKQKTPTIDVST
jgi:hypothetical protein